MISRLNVTNIAFKFSNFSFVSSFRCVSVLPTQLMNFKLNGCCDALIHRNYHQSTKTLAKAKKGGQGKNDDSAPAIPLPDLKTADGNMEKNIFHLTNEFTKLRVGRANTDTFSEIPVESYGTVAAAGQISLKSPTKVSISVYDPDMTKAVSDAIKASGLGVNPTIEGNTVIVNIPKPSKEARDLMVKAASKLADKTKQDIRQVRKDLMDALKKCKGGVSEDDIKRCSKEIDTLTEKKVDKVSALMKAKEKDLTAE